MSALSRKGRFRLLCVLLIAVLLVPSVYAGVTYSEPTTDLSRATAENVTFVSEQGWRKSSTRTGGA